MACVSKIGSLYEMVTKNVIVSTTNTVFGINPRAWIALPCEGLILLKIRQVVPTAGSALPVQTDEVEAEAEAGVLMGRTWGTVVVFTTITVCMRR